MLKVCKTLQATNEQNFPIKVRKRYRTTNVDGVFSLATALVHIDDLEDAV